MSTSRHTTHPLDGNKVRTAPLRDFDEGGIPPWVIEFRVVGTPYLLRAPMERSFIIGRGDPSINHVPEIDLTDYDGQGRGVSRKHVSITAKDNRVTLTDLGSANGTFINGERIAANAEHRLRHGDLLGLGQFNLQVNFIVKPSQDEQTRLNAAEVDAISTIANGETLLVVDENMDVARVIGFCARQSGFNVTAVTTIEDAIAEVDRQMPQAIITELLFDNGEGVDLIRYVREQTNGSKVPIMVVTTTAAGYTTGQALQQGADQFLGKPLATDELIRALSHLVELIREKESA
jgi:CheY-like chemotaxis protein